MVSRRAFDVDEVGTMPRDAASGGPIGKDDRGQMWLRADDALGLGGRNRRAERFNSPRRLIGRAGVDHDDLMNPGPDALDAGFFR